jgi:hypothetical protein
MSEYQRQTAFLRHIILYDDSQERRTLDKSMAQVQRDERCVRRAAAIAAVIPVLATAGLMYGVILQDNFPDTDSRRIISAICALGLAALICLVAFAGLLMVYRRKLNRLRSQCRQLITRLLESHLGKPGTRDAAGSGNSADSRAAARVGIVES